MKTKKLNAYVTTAQATDRDVRQLGVLVSESYETESIDGQTVINLNFSVDLNNKKQVWVFVDGVKLVEGSMSNYTFTNVVSNVSAQITLNAPLIAGLPIQAYKLGAYQESFPNPSSVTATLLNDVAQPHKMAQDAFSPFIKKELITAPFTNIQRRAKVEAVSLKAIAGVERVMCRSLSLIRDEFGVNGEPVYELDNKDSRFRFVGEWLISATSGTVVYTTNISSFLEVTFYGTGLNNLAVNDSALIYSYGVAIDGGVETTISASNVSNVLSNRGYKPNTQIPIVSGLALGWHTVKIRPTNASYSLYSYGVEILNQRTDLAVLAGTAYAGMKQEVLPALSSSAFNAGVVGTRGARVVKYLKDGVVSQAVTEVNASSAFLTSADHTNEEVIRKINWREFGANRNDDFSSLSGTAGSARLFTLDDGTTSLSGNNLFQYSAPFDSLALATNANSFFTLTFVGTGLDVIAGAIGTGSADTMTVQVDGGSIQTILGSPVTNAGPLTYKVCSGLPYGAHTIKFAYGVSGTTRQIISDFILYQPKKPLIPSGAIELCDYNLVANKSVSGTAGVISTGVIRKYAAREVSYVGTWTAIAVDTVSFIGGLNINTGTAAGYAEYSFFGTGIEHETFFNGSAINHTYSIDGSSNLSSYTTQVVSVGLGTVTLAPSTGVLSGTPTGGTSRISITGLALGWHKIRITYNSGNNMYVDAFSIYSPIHINTTTMKVGSMSLKDSRAFSPIVDRPNKIDMNKVKAWCLFDGANSKILAGTNIAAVLKVTVGRYIFFFDKPFKTINFAANATSTSRNIFATGPANYFAVVNAQGANYVQVDLLRNDAVQPDQYVSLSCFGELEDETEI